MMQCIGLASCRGVMCWLGFVEFCKVLSDVGLVLHRTVKCWFLLCKVLFRMVWLCGSVA